LCPISFGRITTTSWCSFEKCLEWCLWMLLFIINIVDFVVALWH
jgi:hypothetical protein